MAGFREHGNEISGFVNPGNFLTLSREGLCSMELTGYLVGYVMLCYVMIVDTLIRFGEYKTKVQT
jgi:hypothetical protein